MTHYFTRYRYIGDVKTQIGAPIPIEEIDLEEIIKKPSRKIYFISDTHLDHTNIIRYCNRPFSSTEEMNNTILGNWNKTVKKDDVVFFLGDMSFGRNSRKTSYWVSELKGNIYFIKGSHDRSKSINFYYSLIIKYKDKKFLLIHNPKNVPKTWDGWVIHGHEHNNRSGDYPLVNKKKKTVNVSVELLNYTPLELEDLLRLTN